MSVGITTLLVASSLIAGQTTPVSTSQSTLMGKSVDEETVYSEEDFPADYVFEPCQDDSAWHQFKYHNSQENVDVYFCQHQSLCMDPSLPFGVDNAVSLTQNKVISNDTYHSKMPYGYVWLNTYEDNASTYGGENNTWSDKEYYSFSVYEESHVVFDVSASSDAIVCNIYQLSYSLDQDGNLCKEWKTIFSQDALVSDTVCFSDTLEPGSYAVEMTRAHTEEERTYFSMDLFLERVKKKTEYIIGDLRFNKNLKAAVWSSSLHPLGMDGLGSLSADDLKNGNFSSEYNRSVGRERWFYGDRTYYERINDIPDEFDYALYNLHEVAQENIIPMDIIYVWDRDTASEIHSFLSSYAQQLENAYDLYGQIYEVVNAYLSALEVVLDAKVTIATAFIPGGPAVSIAVSYLSAFLLDFVLYVAGSTLFPDEWDLDTIKNYCQFIYLLADDARWASRTDDFVLRLPVGYRLKYEKPGMVFGEQGYLYQGASLLKDYSGSLDNYGWDAFYDERRLYSDPEEAFGLPGTFMGLKDVQDDSGQTQTVFGDIDSFEDEYKDVEEIPQIQEDDDVKVRLSRFYDSILAGDCRWLKYTASKSAPHAIIVKSNRQITLETFHRQVKGYSCEGRFGYDEAARQYPDQYDSANKEFVCFYDLKMRKGETVFIRVKGTGKDGEYFSASTPTVYVTYENDNGYPSANLIDQSQALHSHTYGDRYEMKLDSSNAVEPSTQHYSYCWKDDNYELENHTYGLYYDFVAKKYRPRCIKCDYRPRLAASALR